MILGYQQIRHIVTEKRHDVIRREYLAMLADENLMERPDHRKYILTILGEKYNLSPKTIESHVVSVKHIRAMLERTENDGR